jgi:hypothetical protein
MIRRVATAASLEQPSVRPELLGGDPPVPGPRDLGLNCVPVTRANQAMEEGIAVPITVLRSGPNNCGGARGKLLVIDDRDKESLASDPIVQEALRRDYFVIEMDPRGFGELALQKPGWVFAASVLLGENFVWRQGWDVRFMLDRFRDTLHHGTLALYARGPNASLAAAYAIRLGRGPELEWAVLRGGYTSISQFLASSPVLKPSGGDGSIGYEYFAFNALRSPDLPQLLAGSPTKTYLIDSIGGAPAHSDRVQVSTVEEFILAAW